MTLCNLPLVSAILRNHSSVWIPFLHCILQCLTLIAILCSTHVGPITYHYVVISLPLSLSFVPCLYIILHFAKLVELPWNFIYSLFSFILCKFPFRNTFLVQGFKGISVPKNLLSKTFLWCYLFLALFIPTFCSVFILFFFSPHIHHTEICLLIHK